MARLLLLSLAFSVVFGVRIKERSAKGNGVAVLQPPRNTGLSPVAIVMNPGAGVKGELYAEHLGRWQLEAEKVGISMWVAVLGYWFDLPLPGRTKANFKNAIKELEGTGMPKGAPAYFTGHSMGGGAPMDEQNDLFDEGKIQGVIFQASYINRKFWPPFTSELTFKPPTLSVGAELNFGAARITRLAEAAYRQRKMIDRHPVVVVEGMNHMQYASGFEKADLKPEVSDAQAQQAVARVSVDWIAKKMGKSSGAYLSSEIRRTNVLLAPIITAFELEGARNFNVPNQADTPNYDCYKGVCEDGSQWTNEAQAFILGDEVIKSGKVQLQNNFADLNPWSFGDREPRKPILNVNGKGEGDVQSYVMSPYSDKTFKLDAKVPISSVELMGKFISRQNAMQSVFGKTVGQDSDLCKDLNQKAYDYAISAASSKSRSRFLQHGQPMSFGSTVYKGIGPQWVSTTLEMKDQTSSMLVTSAGLFTEPGPRAIDGNHYCKLLSPARAMEWVYVDGLKQKLFAIW